ncbi:hypothetical protein GX48_03507 [Paracoccidioides brasiliensis]|nr:hypothetical protein GX48_03507 [Paracoccidioides brasiliensis]
MSLHDCQLSEAHLIAFFASMEWDPSIPIDRICFSPTETVWQTNPTSVSWQRRSHNDNLQTSSLYLSYSCEVFTHQTAFEGSLSDDTQLQFGFLQQLSAIPENLVVGLVRDKAATDARVEQELPGRNISCKLIGLRKTAAQLSDSVDYLIANAALTSRWSRYRCPVRIPYPGFFLWNSLPTDYVGVGYSMEDPKRLEEDLIQHFRTNAVGNIHLLAWGLRASFAEKGQPRKVSPLPLEWQTMILSLDMMSRQEHPTPLPRPS